jgi:serine/threonine protein kinase
MRPSPSDLIGGKYRIVRLIGDGGMGSVYEARHELLGTPAALKFLHPELARRTGLASRFLQEARVSASIQSPHVTRVTDVDQAPDGAPYLVMELLTGESLQQLLDRSGRLPRDQAIDFSVQILVGLEAAHALGVVHRDLKPDNVFVTPSAGGPLVKLLDFGIAKLRHSGEFQRGLTRPGAVMGTPEYMPPEQLFAADQVDHRADLFSLGAMLYEMLSGQRPAAGDDAAGIVVQVMHGKVRRLSELEPTLPAGLVDVVHRAIEPDRERRWSSATEFRQALIPFAGRLSAAARLAIMPASPPGTARTEDEVAPLGGEPASRAVPPTLPPDDTAPNAPALGGAKGSTQDVPERVLQEIAGGLQAPRRTHPTPVAAPPAFDASSASYGTPGYPAQPPRPARRGRAWGAVVALLLGLLVTGGGIAAMVLLRGQQDDADSSSALPSGAPPATSITAQSPELDAGPPPPATPLPPATGTGKGGKTASKDAGADASGDGGPFHLPFPFPSVLPPLPSGLPPFLPSAWPPVFPPSNVQEPR